MNKLVSADGQRMQALCKLVPCSITDVGFELITTLGLFRVNSFFWEITVFITHFWLYNDANGLHSHTATLHTAGKPTLHNRGTLKLISLFYHSINQKIMSTARNVILFIYFSNEIKIRQMIYKQNPQWTPNINQANDIYTNPSVKTFRL